MNTYSLDLETDSNQYVSITDVAQTGLDITGDLTMEAWVKRESVDAVAILMGKWSVADGNHSYLLTFEADNDFVLYLDADGTGGTAATWTTPSVPVATWTHIAVTYDASAGSAELFINGASVSTQTGLPNSIYDGTATFKLGYPSTSFDGLINEARVWNDIRTDEEIAAYYKQGVAPDSAGLVGYWKLNNNLLDETSNNNDLSDGGNSYAFSTDVPFTESNFLGLL